jgi:hypothetical protein
MDKVQKYNSFNTNTPSSESYRNYLMIHILDYPIEFNFGAYRSIKAYDPYFIRSLSWILSKFSKTIHLTAN